MSAPAVTSSPATLPAWRGELIAGLSATAAMLPLMLTLGLITFGASGPAGAQVGLTAAATSVVLGGLVMALASRAQMPAAAPSAPTSLILGAFVVRLLADPALDPATPGGSAALLALTSAAVVVTGLLLGLLGLLRLGTLARFVPQPVLAGFMNGVALLILWSQLPPLLGLPTGALSRQGLAALQQASWLPLLFGVGTAVVVGMLAARWPKAPAPLLGLGIGLIAGELLMAAWPAAPLPRIGALSATLPLPDALLPLAGPGLDLLWRHGSDLLLTALLLALIGGLESVLSMAAVDQMLNTRTDPNRELLNLAGANLAAGVFGGLPVVYLRLRAIATIGAGGRSRRAVLAGCGVLALLFAVALPVVSRIPAAVLAGIVVMLAWALVDRWTRQLLRQWRAGERTPDLHFSLAIVAVVCAITLRWGFVAGVAAGVLLAMVVFMRAMNRGLIRSRYTAAAVPSRRVYPPALETVLTPLRPRVEVIELEGALFFGNAERLAEEADRLAAGTACLVVDFRRVTTIDASGAVGLAQLSERLSRRGVLLLLAGVTRDNRHGLALQEQGVFRSAEGWQGHVDADHAIEVAEQRLLEAAGHRLAGLQVPLDACALLAGLDDAQRAQVRALLQARKLPAGTRLFDEGDPGDALYVLTEGSVSVVGAGVQQRFVSFSPGMCFGETAVLDGSGRTAAAVADIDSSVHELPAAALQALREHAPDIAARLYLNLALHLSQRLRSAATAWRQAAA